MVTKKVPLFGLIWTQNLSRFLFPPRHSHLSVIFKIAIYNDMIVIILLRGQEGGGLNGNFLKIDFLVALIEGSDIYQMLLIQ